jgi:hypothetical protein
MVLVFCLDIKYMDLQLGGFGFILFRNSSNNRKEVKSNGGLDHRSILQT